MSGRFERLAVVGLGLLGGSVALAARSRRVADRVVGVSRRVEQARQAEAQGLVDEAHADLAAGLRGADLVVLATTLEASLEVAAAAAPHLAQGVVVTDVGSVKGRVVETLPGLLPPGASFVGAHPMTGDHRRGMRHARADLFEGSACILTPTSATPAGALARVRAFWEALGARVLERDPARHDVEVGWVSHLPHALAFAFAGGLADAPRGLHEVQGPGFRDFTRIAWSDPELWAEILVTNRKAVAGPLFELAGAVERLARYIEAGDLEAVERFMAGARAALVSRVGPAPGGAAEHDGREPGRAVRKKGSDEDHS